MTDDELKSVLQLWRAPRAPESLRARVFRRRWHSLAWILSGEIRVPVPVALAALCVLLFAGYRALRPPVSSLSDFQQVQQLEPRIVRAAYEIR